jgi:hypothetical protein
MALLRDKAFNHLYEIPRANEPHKSLSLKAICILSDALREIKRNGFANYDQEYLSKITKCERHQNNRILKQLSDILDIKFYHSVIIEGKKYYNRFLITLQPIADQILNNPKSFYSSSPSKKQSASKKNIVEFVILKKRKENETYH